MKLYESGEYRASKNWPYALAAGCVVYREKNGVVEVFLLKRNAHHPNNPNQSHTSYNLPKGHVDLGETIEAAAVRETEEELACSGELQTFLGSTIRTFTHPKFDIDNEKTVLFFALKWTHDLEAMDDEHDDRVWVGLDEALQLLGETATRNEEIPVQRLKKYLELIV